MNRLLRASVFSFLMWCNACNVTSEAEMLATSTQPLVSTQGRESQGRESQGRESQGTSFTGNFDLKRYLLPTLRTTFDGELTSTVDAPRLVQGQLVIERSLPSGSTSSLKQCFGSEPTGPKRACGWVSSGLGRCTPAAGVKLTPRGGACSGACVGNPMMRVCEGVEPCEASSPGLIAMNDDSCNTPCPSAHFTCPASGRFNVMTGPSNAFEKGAASVQLQASVGVYPAYNVHHGGTDLTGAFIDAEFIDGTTQTFRLGAIVPELEEHVPRTPSGIHGATFRYQVQQPDSKNASEYVDVCGPDDDGVNVAIPVQGWWDKNGTVRFAADSFTFACRRGVISKCYRWGYRAWDTSPDNGLPNNPALSLAQAHQACTRMARADYCGDGRTFTYDGTTINLWDIFKPQVQRRDAQASIDLALSFEAGWSEQGAVCLSHARWDDAPPEIFDPVACPLLFGRGGLLNPRICDTQAQAITHATLEGRLSALFEDSANNHFDGGI